MLWRPPGKRNKCAVRQLEGKNPGGSHERCAEAAATAGAWWREYPLSLQISPHRGLARWTAVKPLHPNGTGS